MPRSAELVERAVQRLHVLRLEVVVHEHDVREALGGERRARVHDQAPERVLAHVDRAGEARGVA